jgi:hypothetical protein
VLPNEEPDSDDGDDASMMIAVTRYASIDGSKSEMSFVPEDVSLMQPLLATYEPFPRQDIGMKHLDS